MFLLPNSSSTQIIDIFLNESFFRTQITQIPQIYANKKILIIYLFFCKETIKALTFRKLIDVQSLNCEDLRHLRHLRSKNVDYIWVGT